MSMYLSSNWWWSNNYNKIFFKQTFALSEFYNWIVELLLILVNCVYMVYVFYIIMQYYVFSASELKWQNTWLLCFITAQVYFTPDFYFTSELPFSIEDNIVKLCLCFFGWSQPLGNDTCSTDACPVTASNPSYKHFCTLDQLYIRYIFFGLGGFHIIALNWCKMNILC